MQKLNDRFDELERDYNLWSQHVPENAKDAMERAISSFDMAVTLIIKSTDAARNDRVQLDEFNQQAATLEDTLNRLEVSIKELKTKLLEDPKSAASISKRIKHRKKFVPGQLGTIIEESEDQMQQFAPVQIDNFDCDEANIMWEEYGQTLGELQQFIKDKYLDHPSPDVQSKGKQRLSQMKEDYTQIEAFADELKAMESKSQNDVKSKCQKWNSKAILTAIRYKKLLSMQMLDYRFDVLEREYNLWNQIVPVPEYAKDAKERAISSFNMAVTLITKSTYAARNDRVQLEEFNQQAATLADSLDKLESSTNDLKTKLLDEPISGPSITKRLKHEKKFFPGQLETIIKESEGQIQQFAPVQIEGSKAKLTANRHKKLLLMQKLNHRFDVLESSLNDLKTKLLNEPRSGPSITKRLKHKKKVFPRLGTNLEEGDESKRSNQQNFDQPEKPETEGQQTSRPLYKKKGIWASAGVLAAIASISIGYNLLDWSAVESSSTVTIPDDTTFVPFNKMSSLEQSTDSPLWIMLAMPFVVVVVAIIMAMVGYYFCVYAKKTSPDKDADVGDNKSGSKHKKKNGTKTGRSSSVSSFASGGRTSRSKNRSKSKGSSPVGSTCATAAVSAQ